MQTEFISSSEAVKLFVEAGLSETTFRRNVKDKKIAKKLQEGRERGASYSVTDIENIISQSRKGEINTTEEIHPQETYYGETDWIKENDLPYILAYDLEMYGIENTVDVSITHAWWKKNHYMCRILYDKNDRRNIWGALTVMPMEEDTIMKILHNEIAEKEITANDVLVCQRGGKYNGYVASATILPGHRTHFRKLLKSMLDYWCDLYPDIQLIKLYALVTSDEGYDLVKHLFFSPRYDIGENAFELDPYKRNPSPFIKDFQKCIQNKTK